MLLAPVRGRRVLLMWQKIAYVLSLLSLPSPSWSMPQTDWIWPGGVRNRKSLVAGWTSTSCQAIMALPSMSRPFLLELHTELGKPYSVCIHPFHHSNYTNVERLSERRYVWMPPVEETLVSYLSPSESYLFNL